MLTGDSKSLLLSGLLGMDGGATPQSGKWTTAFVDKVLNHSGFSIVQVNAAYNQYQIAHTSGTPCP